jgi:hypothetical protein
MVYGLDGWGAKAFIEHGAAVDGRSNEDELRKSSIGRSEQTKMNLIGTGHKKRKAFAKHVVM